MFHPPEPKARFNISLDKIWKGVYAMFDWLSGEGVEGSAKAGSFLFRSFDFISGTLFLKGYVNYGISAV